MEPIVQPNSVADLPALREDPLDATLARLRTMISRSAGIGHKRLPPERELAASFGVSRAAVRKAFDILEAENRVRRHVGRGTFVVGEGGADAVKGAPAKGLVAGFALATIGFSPRELIDARLAVEPAIAELAATAARPSDIEELRRCVRKRETSADAETYEMWDYSLHMAIANAAHNALLVQILEQIQNLRRSNDWRRYRRTTLAPARKRVSDPQHRTIVEAIARHDPRAAAETMRAHILTIRRHLLEEEG